MTSAEPGACGGFGQSEDVSDFGFQRPFLAAGRDCVQAAEPHGDLGKLNTVTDFAPEPEGARVSDLQASRGPAWQKHTKGWFPVTPEV